jgi:hypothetical protein
MCWEVPTDDKPNVVAKCCGNTSCNCTCYYTVQQLHSVEIHNQYHCEECGICLCDHNKAKLLTRPRWTRNGQKELANWIHPLIQSFLTPKCSIHRESPPPEDWVIEYRKHNN